MWFTSGPNDHIFKLQYQDLTIKIYPRKENSNDICIAFQYVLQGNYWRNRKNNNIIQS